MKILPNLFKTLKTGWILLAPIFALIYLLVQGYSPQKSVVLSIVVLIMVSMLTKKTRLTPKKFLEAVTEAGIFATTVAVACAAAGIIVGITTMSGLGLKFTEIVFDISRGILPIALILASLASLATVIGIAAGTQQGYLIKNTKFYERIILLLGAFMIIPRNYMINLLGLILIGATLLSQILLKSKK
ncbi:MAG: TRAP transporter large permease subunit [Thermoplasmata archaeon]|nr:TRAP transporter large permease subunit [Thermoplasmata archaeon]